MKKKEQLGVFNKVVGVTCNKRRKRNRSGNQKLSFRFNRWT